MQSKTKVTSLHFTSVARISHLTKALLTFMWGIPGRCGNPRRVTHLSRERDQMKMRDYMEMRVTPPTRVTSLPMSPPPLSPPSISISISAPVYGYLKLIKAKLKGKKSRKKDSIMVTPMIELGTTCTEGRALTNCAHPSSLTTTKSVL